MYRIDFLRPAGDDWWEGRLRGPHDISIPIKQCTPGATEEEIWTRLQDKCDALNVAQGMVTVAREGWRETNAYRKRNTIDFKARRG